MSKTAEIIKTAVKENIVDRSQVFFWLGLSFLGLLIKLLVWDHIYSSGYSIGTYTFKAMFTYSVGTFFLNRIQMSVHWRVGNHIRSGKLNTHLLKPLDYTLYIFFRSFGTKIFANTLISLPAYIALIFVFRSSLLPPAGIISIATLLLILPLVIILGFLIKYILGLVGFWTTEIGGFYFLIYTLTNFAGGSFVPINAFPKFWSSALNNLPFQYLFDFPINVYLGKLSVQQILQGTMFLCGWIALFSLAALVLWKKGLRRYEAYGG